MSRDITRWAVRDSNPRPLACHAAQTGSEASSVVRNRPLTWADAFSAVRPRPGKFSPVATVVATVVDPFLTTCQSRKGSVDSGVDTSFFRHLFGRHRA